MKAFVLGALLLQTLNAQTTDTTIPDATGTETFEPTTPAPLIIPGPDAPSEAELLSSESDAALGAGAGADVTAQVAATASADNLASAVTAVAEGFSDLASALTSVVAEASLPIGTADVILDVSSSAAATPTADDFVVAPAAADVSATAGAGVNAAAAPPQPGVTSDTSTAATATNSVDALADEPVASPDSASGTGDGGFEAAAFDPATGAYLGGDAGTYDGQDYPGDNTGADDTNYDGQDYPDAPYNGNDNDYNDPDCPAFCYDSDYDTNNNAYPEDTPDPVNPARRAVRARQQPASGGFAAFNWPDNDDGPSAAAYNPQDPCPRSCYGPTTTLRPTYTRTRRPRPTRRPWTTWQPATTTTFRPRPPPFPTTMATSPRPAPPYVQSYTSVLTSDVDWTGATLAGVCPKTCDPFNPALNKCDSTTSCSTSGGTNYYCACRAGFMASGWNAKDFSKQFIVPGQPYVYVAPGVACDQPCADPSCGEVLTRPACK
ncbi:hypothetical protein N0V83_000754 [Neocucurbitaria cava]|uniref:EGF-like domain-containing protein n=1 Tax=Neocucurbitaria cava TaxID=798079 RepID=A0A9W8YH59_9PLEO|nr:hypothetical protein N0V83_000754 [Neocucurbitaria cava]